MVNEDVDHDGDEACRPQIRVFAAEVAYAHPVPEKGNRVAHATREERIRGPCVAPRKYVLQVKLLIVDVVALDCNSI